MRLEFAIYFENGRLKKDPHKLLAFFFEKIERERESVVVGLIFTIGIQWLSAQYSLCVCLMECC